MTRLEGIQEKKHLYNKTKIAEAEALAAEALRMANEAKLAAARLAEVKKTLAMFSNKLESAELSVKKDTPEKTIPAVVKEVSEGTEKDKVSEPAKEEVTAEDPVVDNDTIEVSVSVEEPVKEEAVVETPAEGPIDAPVETPVKTPVVEEPAAEPTKEQKSDPSGTISVASRKREEMKNRRVVFNAPQVFADVPEDRTPKAPLPLTQDRNIVEDFLDSLGVDKACGLDDDTLGFTDRPKVAPPKFENPTRFNYEISNDDVFLNSPSFKEQVVARQLKLKRSASKNSRPSPVKDFPDDLFGADHDDLVMCGKLADICDPPQFDGEIVVPARLQ